MHVGGETSTPVRFQAIQRDSSWPLLHLFTMSCYALSGFNAKCTAKNINEVDTRERGMASPWGIFSASYQKELHSIWLIGCTLNTTVQKFHTNMQVICISMCLFLSLSQYLWRNNILIDFFRIYSPNSQWLRNQIDLQW